MSIRVTVTDTESGDTETREIDNDVLVVTSGTCHIASVQDYPTRAEPLVPVRPGMRWSS